MITDLFTLLTRYPKARIQPWPAVRLGEKRASSSSFDPNIELEFRNQAAAMTDCLLYYKVSWAVDAYCLAAVFERLVPCLGIGQIHRLPGYRRCHYPSTGKNVLRGIRKGEVLYRRPAAVAERRLPSSAVCATTGRGRISAGDSASPSTAVL